jgi:pimeloyl-ACP methyl ester carboxylesterase
MDGADREQCGFQAVIGLGCPPRLNQSIAGELQNAELVVLPGLRHAILLEAPDKVAEPLLRFLLGR